MTKKYELTTETKVVDGKTLIAMQPKASVITVLYY